MRPRIVWNRIDDQLGTGRFCARNTAKAIRPPNKNRQARRWCKPAFGAIALTKASMLEPIAMANMAINIGANEGQEDIAAL